MDTIRQMTYQPALDVGSSVEVLTFERLRALNNRHTQRADFSVLALIDCGEGTVAIDFATHALSPHTAVWIAPGAVHRWDDISDLSGHVIVFVPTAPVTHATRELVASPDLSTTWPIADADWPYVDAARNHLTLETSEFTTLSQMELPQILLSALLARTVPPHRNATSGNAPFLLFRSSVEAHFRAHHDVGYYARTLGYSPRTLTRAVQKVTGSTAKAYIADRVVLEAKRLLVHDRYTASRCATELGFLDASNFSLFFRNSTGFRPGAWQANLASTGTGL
ncbi:MAG: helix-turn-helix transcriptional regulator [Acidobacteria bacterium]|nr:helix-turn-helix transcriptional regulator [Acidobacteriota bacterium]